MATMAGCEAEVGDCDEAALEVYAVDSEGRVQYAGQAIVHRSCAAGVCHASTATGADRKGAPLGLDFDMPISGVDAFGRPDPEYVERAGKSRDRVRSLAGRILRWVDVGAMPPAGSDAGEETLPGHVGATYDLGRCQFGEDVPSVRTDAGREVLRNWLACGAPVIEASDAALARFDQGQVGEISPICVDDRTGAEVTFQIVFDDVLQPYCAGSCHAPGGTNQKLDFSEIEAAYGSLMNEVPDDSICEASIATSFVDVEDVDRSYLLHKMSDSTIPRAERPICGDPMPSGEPALILGAAKVREWISRGALR
jgi:hypothetical protein